MASQRSVKLTQQLLSRMAKSASTRFNGDKIFPYLKVISVQPNGTTHLQWKVAESHLDRSGRFHGGLIAGKKNNLFHFDHRILTQPAHGMTLERRCMDVIYQNIKMKSL